MLLLSTLGYLIIPLCNDCCTLVSFWILKDPMLNGFFSTLNLHKAHNNNIIIIIATATTITITSITIPAMIPRKWKIKNSILLKHYIPGPIGAFVGDTVGQVTAIE